MSGYPLVYQGLQDSYPKVAPVNKGNMGCDGSGGAFITTAILDDAYTTEGLGLKYYKNWNASWYQPSKYSTSILDVNATKMLKKCSETQIANDDVMNRHIQFTGDVDGTVLNPDGKRSPKCVLDGYWWVPPSCRANLSLCVPFVTGGAGWGLEDNMQKATVFNMPWALGTAKSWTEFTQYPFVHPRSTIYWWVPDPTFLELKPVPFIFPPFDKRAFARGEMTSNPSSVSIDTLVSKDLQLLAPNVENFVDNVILSMAQMDEILLDQKNTSDSWRDTTCRWLRNNEATWRSWIPDESKCFAGFGLYDTVLNEYADKRINATNKITCQAGAM